MFDPEIFSYYDLQRQRRSKDINLVFPDWKEGDERVVVLCPHDDDGLLGAGYAVAHVGAAAIGAASERPEIMGRALLFVAMGEGLAVLGLVGGVLLMANLSLNVRERYPQKLFEVGDVVIRAYGSETRAERRLHLAAVVAHSRAGYAEAKGYLDALMRGLGVGDWGVGAVDWPCFIPGRSAEIRLGGEPIGMIGEVHPEVLVGFGLENPVAGFELDLTPFLPGRTRWKR